MLLRALVLARPGDQRRQLNKALDEIDALVTNADSADAARLQLAKKPFDLVILGKASLGNITESFIREIRENPESPDVIALTDSHDVESHAALIAAGCVAALDDAADTETLRKALGTLTERKREEMAHRIQPIPDEDYRLGDYATNSPTMKLFLREARRVASKDATLLLLGETGVGKGLLARALHNEGPRSDGPFVAFNCGALNETLLESELFGHEKGAFTGAERARRGYFELAHMGTIFIDEVGELPLHLQVKLLRILEDKRVRALGSEKDIEVDVRIIAATNKNLEEEVAEQRFRRDLFYRLNVVTLTLPPLRERKEDIPELAQRYIEHFNVRTGSYIKGLTIEALTTLHTHPWPGNLRELINAIERGVIMAVGEELRVEDLPVHVQEFAPLISKGLDVGDVEEADDDWLGRTWAEVRRRVLEEAELRYLSGILKETRGRIDVTAKRAGVDPRSISQKMKKYGLKKETFRSA